jgi:hypothetical protein
MLMTLSGLRTRPLVHDLEEHDERDEREDHAELAGVSAEDLLE